MFTPNSSMTAFYVSVSRASHDAQIFTKSASTLTASLNHSVTKSSALEIPAGPTV